MTTTRRRLLRAAILGSEEEATRLLAGVLERMECEVCDAPFALLGGAERAVAEGRAYELVVLPDGTGVAAAGRALYDLRPSHAPALLIACSEEREGVLREALEHLPLAFVREEPTAASVQAALEELFPSAEDADTAGGARRVLVVDDNPVNRKLAGRMLARLGYESTEAADGREAVEAIGATDFACVLMDCQMPVMDGLEATRVVRERELGTDRRVPILAMTANDREGDVDRCLAAGMDGFLAKPMKLQELEAALNRLLLQHD